jgi:polyhydroxyalkanoate synthesis regulator phasin
MADQVTKKDIESLQKQIDELEKRFGVFVNNKYEKDKSLIFQAILEGDKVAENKVEPLRKEIADLKNRVAKLE